MAVGSSVSVESLRVRAADGYVLGASRFEPQGEARAVAVIAPAMGVPQSFYKTFAGWLASRGVRALTFDYRGVGASRSGSLRGFEADIMTWATQDATAALGAAREGAEGLPALWFGHSLGGQIVPYVGGHEGLARAHLIATGSGYWRHNAAPLRRKVWIFWWGAVPVLTPLFGYFPGQRLGMVGDLPKGVIAQWRSWCMHPEYLVGVVPGARARFAAVRTPITTLSLTDDEMMSERSAQTIEGFYAAAPLTRLRLDPKAEGLGRVGHMGFFRASASPLWEAHVAPALPGGGVSG